MSWINPEFPGVVIHRTPYHTALRKYYVEGIPIAQKFYQLADAERAVEDHDPVTNMNSKTQSVGALLRDALRSLKELRDHVTHDLNQAGADEIRHHPALLARQKAVGRADRILRRAGSGERKD